MTLIDMCSFTALKSTFTALTSLVTPLLSDHFALETTFSVPSSPAVPRRRLSVPAAAWMPCLIHHVVPWYTARKDSLVDANSLYEELLCTIEGFITPRRTPHRPHGTRMPVILTLAARHSTSYYSSGNKPPLYLDSLPPTHQDELACQRPRRLGLVHHSVGLPHDTCVAITHHDLLSPVKRVKSTAPGEDGLTYDIITALLAVRDNNPVLDLFICALPEASCP